jgi:hypothetical protein
MTGPSVRAKPVASFPNRGGRHTRKFLVHIKSGGGRRVVVVLELVDAGKDE